MDKLYNHKFPNLCNVAEKQTSPVDGRYNCIAWAFKDNRRWWWPCKHPRVYWPLDFSKKTEMEAFEDLFDQDGWEQTENCVYEISYEKVALYTLNNEPTHAARLLENGTWTSKLGPGIDLGHSLECLNGPEYGSLFKVYRKPA